MPTIELYEHRRKPRGCGVVPDAQLLIDFKTVVLRQLNQRMAREDTEMVLAWKARVALGERCRAPDHDFIGYVARRRLPAEHQ